MKFINLIIFLHFLLIPSLAPLKFMAQGRVLMNNPASDTDTPQGQGRNVMIGSRPPRCDKKCVAIQVPIVPSIKTNSRGDDTSNYKPICWKCKCGNFIFNP